ncbi:hypothetical protein DITRI_Ditri14bG0041700 [Diplodiscus trichospermus]
MVVQTTLSTTPCFCMGGISRPIILLKIRANAAAFASSSNSSSKPLISHSVANTSSHQEIARPLENYSPDLWGDRFLTLPFTNSVITSLPSYLLHINNSEISAIQTMLKRLI